MPVDVFVESGRPSALAAGRQSGRAARVIPRVTSISPCSRVWSSATTGEGEGGAPRAPAPTPVPTERSHNEARDRGWDERARRADRLAHRQMGARAPALGDDERRARPAVLAAPRVARGHVGDARGRRRAVADADGAAADGPGAGGDAAERGQHAAERVAEQPRRERRRASVAAGTAGVLALVARGVAVRLVRRSGGDVPRSRRRLGLRRPRHRARALVFPALHRICARLLVRRIRAARDRVRVLRGDATHLPPRPAVPSRPQGEASRRAEACRARAPESAPNDRSRVFWGGGARRGRGSAAKPRHDDQADRRLARGDDPHPGARARGPDRADAARGLPHVGAVLARDGRERAVLEALLRPRRRARAGPVRAPPPPPPPPRRPVEE